MDRHLYIAAVIFFCAVMVSAQDTLSSKKDSSSVFGKDVNLEEVIVSSSRISSYINANPLRVEVLGGEDLLEKAIENPASISEMLTELSAVQVVQTSLFSGNTNFRLLGLRGEQTLLLKDGFPMFGGLSQDLSFMHIAPFNIKQVEIIKGASSIFWGNGAIAGVINVLTKEPQKKSTLNILANRSTLGSIKKNLPGSTDFALFASGRNETLGYTLSSNVNYKNALDVNGDGFSEVPDMNKVELEPKLYYYFDDRTSLSVDGDYIKDKRTGGSMNHFYTSDSSAYYTDISSIRRSAFVTFNKLFDNNNSLQVKSSYYYMNKLSKENFSSFSGKQTASYSEVSYSNNHQNNNFALGVNFSSDFFQEDRTYGARNYNSTIAGLFVEYQYKFSDEITSEAGIRFDHNNIYGSFFVPAVSIIYKPSNVFFARLNAGTGYRIPSLFATDIESAIFELELPGSEVNPERSSSVIFDLNYTLFIGGISARINQIFYSAHVNDPLDIKNNVEHRTLKYANDKAVNTYGTETNLNVSMDEAAFFAGFSYNHSPLELTPDYKLVFMLSFEEEETGLRIDAGGMTIGKQTLFDGTIVNGYSTFELLLSKKFGKFTFVLNGENLFDYKQSSRTPLVAGDIESPSFFEIYSPVTGRELNIAVLFSL